MFVIPKKFSIELERKREGQKNPKVYVLTVLQDDYFSEPEFSFVETTSGGVDKTKISRDGNRSIFDYNQTIKVINFARHFMKHFTLREQVGQDLLLLIFLKIFSYLNAIMLVDKIGMEEDTSLQLAQIKVR